jgi:hypothetical protein
MMAIKSKEQTIAIRTLDQAFSKARSSSQEKKPKSSTLPASKAIWIRKSSKTKYRRSKFDPIRTKNSPLLPKIKRNSTKSKRRLEKAMRKNKKGHPMRFKTSGT